MKDKVLYYVGEPIGGPFGEPTHGFAWERCQRLPTHGFEAARYLYRANGKTFYVIGVVDDDEGPASWGPLSEDDLEELLANEQVLLFADEREGDHVIRAACPYCLSLEVRDRQQQLQEEFDAELVETHSAFEEEEWPRNHLLCEPSLAAARQWLAGRQPVRTMDGWFII